MKQRIFPSLVFLIAAAFLLNGCGGHSRSTPQAAANPPLVETPAVATPPSLNDCLQLTPGTSFTTSAGDTHQIINEAFNGIPAIANVRLNAQGDRQEAEYFRQEDRFLRRLGEISYDDAGRPVDEIENAGAIGFPAELVPGQMVNQEYVLKEEKFNTKGELLSTTNENVTSSVHFEGFVDLDLAGEHFANVCKLTVRNDLRDQSLSLLWIAHGFGVIREDAYDAQGEFDEDDSLVITAVLARP